MSVHGIHHEGDDPIGADTGEVAERSEQRARDAVHVDRCRQLGGFPTLLIAYASQRPNRQLRPAFV